MSNYCVNCETTAMRAEKATTIAAQEHDRAEKAEAEVERLRMSLVACGVVACADTPESAAKVRDMHPNYRSASCNDVARRVDECMALRAEVERLRDIIVPGDAAAYEEGMAALQAKVKALIEAGDELASVAGCVENGPNPEFALNAWAEAKRAALRGGE